MKLTDDMMVMLRMRRGLDGHDTSEDKEILAMSPREIVQECAAWRLGYGSWATTIAGWMVAAGAKPEDF